MARTFFCMAAAVVMTACKMGESPATPRVDSAAARLAVRDSVRADSLARVRQDSINRTLPGYVVDSILPVDEQLRRFRASIPGDSATHFAHASSSRDALVKRFGDALAASDSLAMRDMLITAREFADLFYPESQFTKPPLREAPAVVWMTIQNPSASGFRRLLRRVAGTSIRVAGYTCDPNPQHYGANTLWNCQVKVPDLKGNVTLHRYFGSIVERHGEFKFLSYKNEF